MNPSLPLTSSQRQWGWVLALLGAVAFSGKAIIVKLAYRHGAADAVTLLMYRMLFAAPLFLAMAWWASRGKTPLTQRDGLGVVGLGFTGYYLASFLDFWGLQYISASLERLILYLNPTLVLLLGWWLYGRRVTSRQWGAMAVSYLGVAVVMSHELQLDASDLGTWWGVGLVFASALSYAVYMTYSGELVQRVGSMRLVGLASSVACVLCVGQFALLRPLEAAWVPEPVVWLSLLNALACTVAPVLMVMMAIERIGSSMTAQMGMVGPLSTIVLGIWWLGEPLTIRVVIGTVAVMMGVWWVSRPVRSVAPPSDS